MMNSYGTQFFEPVGNGEGLNRLQHNTCRVLNFELLVLGPGQVHEFDAREREWRIVSLTGTVDIALDDKKFEDVGGRRSVFDAPPSAVYSPPQKTIRISARTGAEVAICSCPATGEFEAYRIDPKDAIQGSWGNFNTTRSYNYMINSDRPSERLHLAEVTVQSGNWATYPPHKHDENRPELGEVFQEEMYFYRTDDPNGFGLCASYGELAGGDYAFIARNNTIHKMPSGYHTVCAAPGYKLWYLALIGGDDKRHAVRTDPQHAWYNRAEVALGNIRGSLLGPKG